MIRKLTKQQQTRIKAKQDQTQQSFIEDANGLTGIVITQHGSHVLIRNEQGIDILAKSRQHLGAITTGDIVGYQLLEENSAIINHRLERSSLLSRIGYGGKEKLIAANIDQVMVVIAPQPEPSPSLIDRYLVVIKSLDLEAIILINKADLLDDYPQDALIEQFTQLGYRVLLCCASPTQNHAHIGMEQLNEALKDKTSIFVGQSGVGKSSLTNVLLPDLGIRTQLISAKTGLGNHTTSASALYDLPNGGFIIDSPGVRSFEIDHMSTADIDRGFIEIYPHLGQCKFRDCRHLKDPDCVFTQLIHTQTISRRRMQSYLQIRAAHEGNTK